MKTSRLNWLGAFYVCSGASLFALQAPQPPSPPNQSPVPVAGSIPTLTPRSHDERERNYEAEHRIILNVEATDASGAPVAGLKDEDFTLLDNHLPQKLLSFQTRNGYAPEARTRAMLVLDTTNISSRTLGNERKGIEKFFGQNQGRLDFPISVAVFSSTGIQASQPSQDGYALIADLERLSGGLHAASCVEDENDPGWGQPFAGRSGVPLSDRAAMQTQPTPSKLADCENTEFKRAVSELNLLASKEADAPGRVILIWIGPGWPQLSRHEIKPDTPAMKQNLFDYRVELLTGLRKAQVTLDAISFPDSERDAEPNGAADKAIANGVARADEASAASMALRVLVHETGGRTLDRGKDVSNSIAACLADAASYYVLSFNSAGGSKEGEYHELKVRVNRPGVTARTNRAYYAVP